MRKSGWKGKYPSEIPSFSGRIEFPSLSACEDNIWSETIERFGGGGVPSMQIVALGFNAVERTWLKCSLERIGLKTVPVATHLFNLSSISEVEQRFSHAIINFDSYASTEDAVDALISFRQKDLGLCVVVVTTRVARDDLGLERSAICDVTLRWPLTDKRLWEGLVEGWANHYRMSHILGTTEEPPDSGVI